MCLKAIDKEKPSSTENYILQLSLKAVYWLGLETEFEAA